MCLLSRSFVNIYQFEAYWLKFLKIHVDIAASCGELSNYPIKEGKKLPYKEGNYPLFLICLNNMGLATLRGNTNCIFMSKVSGESY